jgi:hypothetical protein
LIAVSETITTTDEFVDEVEVTGEFVLADVVDVIVVVEELLDVE